MPCRGMMRNLGPPPLRLIIRTAQEGRAPSRPKPNPARSTQHQDDTEVRAPAYAKAATARQAVAA